MEIWHCRSHDIVEMKFPNLFRWTRLHIIFHTDISLPSFQLLLLLFSASWREKKIKKKMFSMSGKISRIYYTQIKICFKSNLNINAHSNNSIPGWSCILLQYRQVWIACFIDLFTFISNISIWNNGEKEKKDFESFAIRIKCQTGLWSFCTDVLLHIAKKPKLSIYGNLQIGKLLRIQIGHNFGGIFGICHF